MSLFRGQNVLVSRTKCPCFADKMSLFRGQNVPGHAPRFLAKIVSCGQFVTNVKAFWFDTVCNRAFARAKGFLHQTSPPSKKDREA